MEMSAQAVHDSRQQYHRLASAFDEPEGSLNEGLGCIHKLIAEVTTAQHWGSNVQRARVLEECPRPNRTLNEELEEMKMCGAFEASRVAQDG